MQDIDITPTTDPDVEEGLDVDPLSLISGKIKQSIECLPDNLKQLTEWDLEKLVNPTPVDWQLRLRFHQKLAEAKALKLDRVTTASIFEDICSRVYFFDNYLPNPVKVAWMSRPIIDHRDIYEAINREGLNKILEYVKTAKVTDKNLAVIAKVVETAGNRAYGAVAQNMQIHSKNLNVEVSGKMAELPPVPGVDDIQKQIQGLQQKLIESKAPKDVTEI